MWYFSWILGVGLAAAFAILNAMWFELDADREALTKPTEASGAGDRAPPRG
jgi:cyd operon protein YbgT